MTTCEEMMLKILEKELKKQRKWMSKEGKEKVVQEACHLFLEEDYSNEENAVKDALSSAEDVINGFSLSISFDGSHLYIDYCDGSDVEVTKINCKDDILIALQEAAETVMEPEADEKGENICYQKKMQKNWLKPDCIDVNQTRSIEHKCIGTICIIVVIGRFES